MGAPLSSDRPLPQALEAERALLGGLLLDPGQLADLAELVGVETFYRPAHGRLFGLLVQMQEAGDPIELTSVLLRLDALGQLDEAGGRAYVSALSDSVPSTVNLRWYAEQVRDADLRRRLVLRGRDLVEHASGGTLPTGEIVDWARGELDQVANAGAAGWRTSAEVVDAAYLRIQRIASHPGAVTGVPSKFVELDRMTAGLNQPDLVILAARPAMGKSALAMGIAEAVASSGRAVGVFSLEMGAEQLGTRSLCGMSGVSMGAVRTGHISRAEGWPALTAAHGLLSELPLFFDDTPALTPAQIRARARRLKAQRPDLALIVVDYLQLMGAADPRAPREQQVSGASRALKALAKELQIVVLALSQLNRGVEARSDKRPLLSDLRESGAIEQDADVILFIYRDEYYNRDSVDKGVAEVIVAKQRNGPTGTVRLAWVGERTQFANLLETTDGYV